MKTLREWRLNRLLSIGELARRSGVTKKSIIELEHGRRPAPQFDTMRRICEVLDVQPGDVAEFGAVLEVRSKDAA